MIMDYVINFSSRYAEIEEDSRNPSSQDFIVAENVYDEHLTPNKSYTIASPLMFSRQTSLDSLSTPSRQAFSVQSDYSYPSSSISPSEIPDSPSEMNVENSTLKSELKINKADDGFAVSDDDEHDNSLLEKCLRTGIHAMQHSDSDRNNLYRSVACGNRSPVSVCSDSIDSEKKLLEGCWRYGVKSFVVRKPLVTLAFAGSIGMTLIILACALPQYQMWWPFFVVLFYIFSVCPTLLAKRSMNNSLSGSSPCLELAIFLTMGFVISSFALPIVLARADVIMWGACYLTLCGNFVVYGTIVGYFLLFDSEDNVYGGMA